MIPGVYYGSKTDLRPNFLTIVLNTMSYYIRSWNNKSRPFFAVKLYWQTCIQTTGWSRCSQHSWLTIVFTRDWQIKPQRNRMPSLHHYSFGTNRLQRCYTSVMTTQATDNFPVFERLFRMKTKETSKLGITSILRGKSTDKRHSDDPHEGTVMCKALHCITPS